jgi:hypothetical protein
MAWATFEAELLYAITDTESSVPEYDESIEAYIAVSLWDEGYVIPPAGLGAAAAELKKRLNPEASLLRSEVEKAWAELPKDRLDVHKIKDGALGAQLLKLAEPWLYVGERTRSLREYLGKF